MNRPHEIPSSLATKTQLLWLCAYLIAVSTVALGFLIGFWPSSEVMTADEASREAVAAQDDAKKAETALEEAKKAEMNSKKEDTEAPRDVEKASQETKTSAEDLKRATDEAKTADAALKTAKNAEEVNAKQLELTKKQKTLAHYQERSTAAEKSLSKATQNRAAAEKKLTDATQNRTAAEKNQAIAKDWAEVSEKINGAVQGIASFEAKRYDHPAPVPHVYRNASARMGDGRTLLALIIAAAALGSCIHAMTSFSDYVGDRRLTRTWLSWYYFRPWLGAMLAVIFYLVLWCGTHSHDSIASSSASCWIIGVAGLVGLFSKQATDKLNEVFTVLIKSDTDAKRKDKLDRNNWPRITRVVATKRDGNSGVVTINVMGERFVTGARVQRSGADRKTTFTSSGLLVAELLAEDVCTPGQIELVVVNPEPPGGESSSFPVTVHPAPVISAAKLDVTDCKSVGDVAKIIVEGHDFVAGSVVECGQEGADRETKLDKDTVLYAFLHKSDRAIDGPSKVRVVNPLLGGGASAWLRINTLPKIAGLRLDRKIVANKEEVTFVVKGSNFVHPVRVWYGGKEKTATTTFVSGSELCVRLDPEDYDKPGSYEVKVCNPDPVGGMAEPFTLDLPPLPVPTLIQIEPAEAKMGVSVSLTITGTHFTPQTLVLFGEKLLTPDPTTRTDTSITVTLSASDTANAGDYPIAVVNPKPGGGKAAWPQLFKVTH